MGKKLVHLRASLAPGDHVGLLATAMSIADFAHAEGGRPETIRVTKHPEDGPYFRPKVLLDVSWIIPDRRKGTVLRAREEDIRDQITEALS